VSRAARRRSRRLRRVAPLVALGLAVTGCTAPTAGDAPVPAQDPPPAEEAGPAVAPLTGEPTEQDLGERPLVVVKVENTPQASPQSGLEAADVVLEELVEGGVTRFVALFHAEIPAVVGPVRSARPVDVELLSGFAAAPALAYSGARPEVQAMLDASRLVLVTEGGPGFYRSAERRAPHDLYVRLPEALEAVAARGATPPADEAAWRFEDAPPPGAVDCPPDAEDCQPPGDVVHVAMSSTYRTTFTYDREAGVYRRDQNGRPTVVTGTGRIGAANVVVLATEQYESGCCDTAGNPYVETRATGAGPAVALRDGRWYEVRWRKTAAGAPLELLDGEGAPFPLRPGATWLLLPSEDRLPRPPGVP
jgi:hypothetical protein